MSGDENFEFYCPNCPRNVQNALAVFHRYFAGIGFDGVFLDKIRYPSFVSGLDGGFSCFCPRCLETYQREDIDPSALQALMREGSDTPFGVIAYQDGRYTFKNELWSRFFALKSRIVTDAVGSLCIELRRRGYKVGLDVFAPFASAFVGQDIPKLSEFCDFIKPMMYRATHAPAGLPFELEALLRGSAARAPRIFYDILGLNGKETPFDLAFSARELEGMVRDCKCPIYAGLEVNRIPGIADTDPGYVRETLAAYSAAAGAVLSWNLLDAPAENIAAASQSAT